MFNTQFGLLNQWMEKLGLETARWLSSDFSAFICCTVVNLWLALPFMIMIMDGAMQSIDRSYEESALLDGANWLQRTRYITVPAIKPIIAPAVIITVFTLPSSSSTWCICSPSRLGPRPAPAFIPS